MSEHMSAHPIDFQAERVRIYNENNVYELPKKVLARYRVQNEEPIPANQLFSEINQKYTKPGALLRGLRIREQLTQKEMAKRLEVTQANISQMEKGVRPIGRKVAQRIEKIFSVNYRAFLA